jgi:hypothetical protein
MPAFTYEQIKVEDESRLADAFCAEHGTQPNGRITDAQFDVIYDHLVDTLEKFATFSEGGGDGDYSSSRYVDQIPWIRVVAEGEAAPSTSVKAGLEAVRSSPTPLAVAFDYYPHLILVLPPARVLSTYDEGELQSASSETT